MASDFKPFNAFRAHAAQVLQVKPEQLEGGADTEEAAQRMPHTVGGAWAYTNFVSADPPRDVRGWVTADATVITPTQNLGRLFVEAGVWTKTPSLTAGQLAEHLAWAYGMNHAVFIEPENGAPAPRLKLADDGSGTFRFFLDSKPAGPGGAGGGPADVFEVNVTLTPDHQATLTKTPFQLP